VFGEDYIRTARAKGLSGMRVIVGHALRNASLPVVTVVGLEVGSLLGGAILMGIIWIPYGWAADDPVGLQHAVGRALLSYVAFVYVPSPYKATGISCVVLLAYLYSLLRMKRPPKDVTGR